MCEVGSQLHLPHGILGLADLGLEPDGSDVLPADLHHLLHLVPLGPCGGHHEGHGGQDVCKQGLGLRKLARVEGLVGQLQLLNQARHLQRDHGQGIFGGDALLGVAGEVGAHGGGQGQHRQQARGGRVHPHEVRAQGREVDGGDLAVQELHGRLEAAGRRVVRRVARVLGPQGRHGGPRRGQLERVKGLAAPGPPRATAPCLPHW
mmetsp:Transcript_4819/g.7229  ORF Transcript_4819/g.7229 Transcript_4819/m.7229 type:complete len:205 (+) Transcript_4819:561-1175(+)